MIVTVAPCGAEVGRDDNPAVPYTPTEIADAVVAAAEAGASIAHLHVREPDGRPAHRVELYRETIELVRSRSDVLCNVSTGGAIGMTIDERLDCLGASPDLAGVETGSLNFAGEPFVTSGDDAERVIVAAEGAGAVLEAECFDLGHVAEAARAAGRHAAIRLVNLVLGVPGGAPATPAALQALAAEVPPTLPWTVTCVGRHQRRLLALALLHGSAGIRVGFEDNVYRSRGVLAASNAELVADAVALCRAVGREPATVAETRRILGLTDRGSA